MSSCENCKKMELVDGVKPNCSECIKNMRKYICTNCGVESFVKWRKTILSGRRLCFDCNDQILRDANEKIEMKRLEMEADSIIEQIYNEVNN